MPETVYNDGLNLPYSLEAEQAVLGTAKYLLETGTHPAVLKDMVSSPAGTTIEAVAALEAGGMRAAVIDAARAAAQRNRDM